LVEDGVVERGDRLEGRVALGDAQVEAPDPGFLPGYGQVRDVGPAAEDRLRRLEVEVVEVVGLAAELRIAEVERVLPVQVAQVGGDDRKEGAPGERHSGFALLDSLARGAGRG